MNLRTRLSRSNGYRELGMFDESILELEAIEFGEDRGIATTYHSGNKEYHHFPHQAACFTLSPLMIASTSFGSYRMHLGDNWTLGKVPAISILLIVLPEHCNTSMTSFLVSSFEFLKYSIVLSKE